MAYGIECNGTSVKYWVDHGDSLPLHWKVQKSDGTFEPLTHPNTFTIRPYGSAWNATPIHEEQLTEAGDYAVGTLDTSAVTGLLKGKSYDVAYYDPVLDVSLRGVLKIR